MKRFLVLSPLYLIASGMLAAGCSHAALDQQIDAKLDKMPPIEENAILRADIRHDIEASSLSEDQKKRLLALSDRVGAQLDELRQHSRKLRALLAEDLTQPGYDSTEVDQIKSRLKDVENQRLAAVFSSVDEANSIIGRNDVESRVLLSHFLANQEGRHSQGR